MGGPYYALFNGVVREGLASAVAGRGRAAAVQQPRGARIEGRRLTH
jgi:hypothetical protein